MVKMHIQEPASSAHTFNIITQEYRTGKWQPNLNPDLLTLFLSVSISSKGPLDNSDIHKELLSDFPHPHSFGTWKTLKPCTDEAGNSFLELRSLLHSLNSKVINQLL